MSSGSSRKACCTRLGSTSTMTHSRCMVLPTQLQFYAMYWLCLVSLTAGKKTTNTTEHLRLQPSSAPCRKEQQCLQPLSACLCAPLLVQVLVMATDAIDFQQFITDVLYNVPHAIGFLPAGLIDIFLAYQLVDASQVKAIPNSTPFNGNQSEQRDKNVVTQPQTNEISCALTISDS